jgi:hypothetical protein
MSVLPAGPYTVKNLSPVVGMLYSFEYAWANNSFDFFVAAYRETGLSTLSSVEYGTFLFEPYTDELDAYTKCSTGMFLQASRML